MAGRPRCSGCPRCAAPPSVRPSTSATCSLVDVLASDPVMPTTSGSNRSRHAVAAGSSAVPGSATMDDVTSCSAMSADNCVAAVWSLATSAAAPAPMAAPGIDGRWCVRRGARRTPAQAAPGGNRPRPGCTAAGPKGAARGHAMSGVRSRLSARPDRAGSVVGDTVGLTALGRAGRYALSPLHGPRHCRTRAVPTVTDVRLLSRVASACSAYRSLEHRSAMLPRSGSPASGWEERLRFWVGMTVQGHALEELVRGDIQTVIARLLGDRVGLGDADGHHGLRAVAPDIAHEREVERVRVLLLIAGRARSARSRSCRPPRSDG